MPEVITLVLPGTHTPRWKYDPVHQLMATRQPDGLWQLHVQVANRNGVRQHTRDAVSFPELVEALNGTGWPSLGLDHNVLAALETAISDACEEDGVRELLQGDALLWSAERYVRRWVEEDPTWTRDHGGDVTTAVAAYLQRFDHDEDVDVQQVTPDPEAFMPDRILGAYRISNAYPPAWSVVIDVAVDGAGEVFGRVREGTFAAADGPVIR